MTDWYDDDEDGEQRPVPTLDEALRDLGRVFAAPFVRRAERVARWYSRLVTFEVDWSSFAVTRGGFFDWFGGPTPYRPDSTVAAELREAALVRVASGFQVPWEPPAWQPWAKWYPAFDWSMANMLPTVSVQRGGIRLIEPPLPSHHL